MGITQNAAVQIRQVFFSASKMRRSPSPARVINENFEQPDLNTHF